MSAFENLLSEKDESISILKQELKNIKNNEKFNSKSDELYKIIFESSQDAIMLLNEDGFFDCNHKTLELFGLNSIEEFTHTHPADLSPEFQPNGSNSYFLADAKINFALENGSNSFEWVHKKKDGSTFQAEVLISKFLSNGNWFIQATVRDITLRNEKYNQLINSENQLRTVLATEPECVKTVNKKGELLEMNVAGLAMIEADNLNQVRNFMVVDLIDPEFKNDFKNLNSEVFKGNSQKLIFKLNGLKGTKRWVETHAVPLKNIKGEIISHLAITRDITKQKKIEDELNTSKSNLQAVFDNTEVGYILLSKDLKVLAFNEVAKQINIFEHKMELEIGSIYYDYFSIERQIELKSVIDKVLLGEKVEYELDFSNNPNLRQNSNKWYFIKYIPTFNKNNIVEGFVMSIADITNQKNNEIELKNSLNLIEENNNVLESIIKEKDKFFSIIAHDLKSPFSGFLGITQLLSSEMTKLTVNELIEYTKTLKESAENLYKLLENLLEWSILHRGLNSFTPELVSLNYLINNNIVIAKTKAELKGITFAYNLNNEFRIKADTQMLNGILRNLISNSLKFTPRGGIIEINVLDKVNELQISIKDNGIGMNDELLKILFNIGEKTSRNGTEDETSTGLGLLLCKEYIEKHNGTIWAESEIGKGTTFFFTIPKTN